MNEIPVIRKNFKKQNSWFTIIKSTNDIYVLATTFFMFTVSFFIIIEELKRVETDYAVLAYDEIEIRIPMALLISFITVILTTIVNNFRLLLNLFIMFIKNKIVVGRK